MANTLHKLAIDELVKLTRQLESGEVEAYRYDHIEEEDFISLTVKAEKSSKSLIPEESTT